MANSTSEGFSDFEKEAMRTRAKELATEKRQDQKREQGEQAVMRALAEMMPADRKIGEKIHLIARELAPELWPKTWYGFPAYAIDGKHVVFFYQSAQKAEERYATLGFTGIAHLDEGAMWPTSYALQHIGKAEESLIRKLISRAISMHKT